MKKLVFMAALMLGFMATSCNNTEPADSQNKPATRAGQVTNLDLRDFGKVHNLIMDYGQSQLAQNSGISPMSTDNEVFVGNLNNAIKDNMANFLRNTTISSLCGDMVDSMDDYLEYYGTYIDEHFLEPIPNLVVNGVQIEGQGILEQLYNCGMLTDHDYDLLKQLAGIATDNNNSISAYADQLQNVLSEWRDIYGEEATFATDSKGLISGACIQIALYSSQWWSLSYRYENGKGPNRIAPWLAYLAGKDLKGAIHGVATHLLACAVEGNNPTWNGVGTAALVGGVANSLGGLF